MLNRRHPGCCRFGCAAVAVPDGGVGRCLASQEPCLQTGWEGSARGEAGVGPWSPLLYFPRLVSVARTCGEMSEPGKYFEIAQLGGVSDLVCYWQDCGEGGRSLIDVRVVGIFPSGHLPF